MAIFPNVTVDEVVQVNDKVRIDATKSYISKGEPAITLVEIEAEAGSGFIAVQGTPIKEKNFYLDWEYGTAGTKVVSVRITTSGAPVVVTKSITVVTEAVDKLFSTDYDLTRIDSGILSLLPDGRSSFKYIHREAQSEILEWLYTMGYMKSDNVRFDKDDIINIEEVKYWSKYMALRLIYSDNSNSLQDVYASQANDAENDEHKWRQKSLFKIDVNGDGIQDNFEGFNLTTKNFIRE
jgi:hypothetical protein